MLARGAGLIIPLPPVRWVNPHGHICVGLDPTAKNTTAGKHEGVNTIEVDHGQFQVAIKWRGFDAEPIHSDAIIKRRLACDLIVVDTPYCYGDKLEHCRQLEYFS